MADANYSGLLFIGDPHMEGRIPGFRKDEYPRVVLEKLDWAMRYARTHDLLPAVLGDMFHLPRDNPNWLVVELLGILHGEVLAIYGNHDCHENSLTDDDSFSILVRAGRLRLVSETSPWRGRVGGREVVVGGTPWGQWVPKAVDRDSTNGRALVFWMTHHDVKVPGYEEQGRFVPQEIPGIDVVINGHIHRHLEDALTGGTVWLTPGNISRRNRGDATRTHVPSVLRIDVHADGWRAEKVQVPHRLFEEVFHEEILDAVEDSSESAFVAGLAELQARRTETGAGLKGFLDKNLGQFEEDVAREIWQLANEVMGNGEEEHSGINKA
jgi:predicted phosphodiesterase